MLVGNGIASTDPSSSFIGLEEEDHYMNEALYTSVGHQHSSKLSKPSRSIDDSTYTVNRSDIDIDTKGSHIEVDQNNIDTLLIEIKT